MKILSIDVGIINLGYVFCSVENDVIDVIHCDRVDITYVKHCNVKWGDCKLHHENCIPDYLDHFIQENNTFFEEADIVLIERQPPVGITNVQDLLFTRFRSKVKLISPNSVHKHFMMSKDYSIRKIQSENITTEYLKEISTFIYNTRKHDICDAMLLVMYYAKKFKKKEIVTDFDIYRFIRKANE
jgi:hypothetical protein